MEEVTATTHPILDNKGQIMVGMALIQTQPQIFTIRTRAVCMRTRRKRSEMS